MPAQPMYDLNLDRVANQPISEGIHAFVISDITEGESSNNNPMWTVRLKCLDEGPENGKEATLWLVLIDSMRWKTEKFLDAVQAPPTGSAPYTAFIGRKFRAQISHRKDEQSGRINADVGEMYVFAAKAPAPHQAAARPAGTPPATVQTTGVKSTATVKRSKGLPADSQEQMNV